MNSCYTPGGAFFALFVGIVILFASCHTTPTPVWQYEIGDRVQHISGIEAVVVDRNIDILDRKVLRYFIRYKTDTGFLETRRVFSWELKPVED